MTLFVFFAALMCAIAVAFVVLPLRAAEAHDKGSGSNNQAIIASIVFIPVLALGVYLSLSNWIWDASATGDASAPSLDDAIAKLEQRVTTTGGTIQDWYMLGRSYVVMQQYERAVPAFREAYNMTQGQDPDITIALAEAMAMTDENALDGEAGELIEKSVTAAPGNPKALWYGGLVAERRGQNEVAVERYRRLMTLAPPEPMQNLLLQRIQALGGTVDTTQAPAAAGLAPDTSQSLTGSQTAPDAAIGSGIAVTVTMADDVRESITENLTLFILARDMSGTGPPIAVVRRRVADLPLSVTLTDEQAMIPTRKISNFEEVQIVARVSRSGQPVAQTGDVFGQTNASNGDSIALIIDQVVP